MTDDARTTTRRLLLDRLDDLGRSLAANGDALALLALGSVGLETDRLDEYSDLDFFVVVRPGSKHRYLADLRWLSAAGPLDWAFRNTPDGFKALFHDGVFCEFAVFEEHELAGIPFAEGRIVWKADGVSDSLARPVRAPRTPDAPDRAWLIGEALSCLYVGLGRYRRGEKLSALRFVQSYAFDKLLQLIQPPTGPADRFSPERRFEQRASHLVPLLERALGGYARTPDAALAQLEFLEAHFEVNAPLAARIRALAAAT